MRPIVDVWLEIVKGQLAAGDSAVIACSKANIVSQQYQERFRQAPVSQMSPEAAIAWFEQIRSDAKAQAEAACGMTPEDLTIEKYETPLSIPPSSYVAGDENARS